MTDTQVKPRFIIELLWFFILIIFLSAYTVMELEKVSFLYKRDQNTFNWMW